MTLVSASASSGAQVLANPMLCGKASASRAIKPLQHSSWIMAGMPSRVLAASQAWVAAVAAATCGGRMGLPPAGRTTWPMPRGMRAWALSGTKASWSIRSFIHSAPSWATFSSSVMRARRSATRSAMGRAALR